MATNGENGNGFYKWIATGLLGAAVTALFMLYTKVDNISTTLAVLEYRVGEMEKKIGKLEGI